jgi:hypothetical protein
MVEPGHLLYFDLVVLEDGDKPDIAKFESRNTFPRG